MMSAKQDEDTTLKRRQDIRPGVLSFDGLQHATGEGKIDTVLACFVDMQGRLMGKRFHARHFCDSAFEETHCCDYLLATDLEMHTVPGYRASGWQAGYGDYVMRPDMATIRPVPWLEGTALVLCDVLDHHHHQPVPHSPRAMLKRQIKRLEDRSMEAMMATELEFFLFNDSYETLRDRAYRDLVPLGRINQDYNILQTTKEETVMRAIRNGLYGAGIPVENSKGEAETGQEEINIRYATALETADYHTIAKNAIKEIAASFGHAASFMPKWHHNKVGSSAHVHQSLWRDGVPLFYDGQDPLGMSALMKQFTAGQLKYASEYCITLAPYINSYKRFKTGSFAPTSPVWSVDNRSAGFRLCGTSSRGVRMECRIGGSDINPYVAMTALLAAGIAGIDEELELEPALSGDIYEAGKSRPLPANLRDAADRADSSQMLREALGNEVVDHYVRAARWECEEYERVVTDFEVARLFEQC